MHFAKSQAFESPPSFWQNSIGSSAAKMGNPAGIKQLKTEKAQSRCLFCKLFAEVCCLNETRRLQFVQRYGV